VKTHTGLGKKRRSNLGHVCSDVNRVAGKKRYLRGAKKAGKGGKREGNAKQKSLILERFSRLDLGKAGTKNLERGPQRSMLERIPWPGTNKEGSRYRIRDRLRGEKRARSEKKIPGDRNPGRYTQIFDETHSHAPLSRSGGEGFLGDRGKGRRTEGVMPLSRGKKNEWTKKPRAHTQKRKSLEKFQGLQV